AVMDRGKVIACDTPDALIRQLGTAATVRARIAAGELTPEDLAALTGVTASTDHNSQIELRTTDVQSTLVDLLALATRKDVLLTALHSTQASLEDVFLSLTGRTYENEADGQTDKRTNGQADGDGGKKKRRSS